MLCFYWEIHMDFSLSLSFQLLSLIITSVQHTLIELCRAQVYYGPSQAQIRVLAGYIPVCRF